MDFALTADQRLMQTSIAGVLDRVSPLTRVRAFSEANEPVAGDVWRALAGLGVPGLLLAEGLGGLGLTLLDAALVAEILGAHAAPSPFLGGAILAPLAIAQAGSEAQREAWAPKLAAGEIVAGVAVHEAIAGARDGAGVTAGDRRLTGQSLFAVDAVGADILIVADVAGGLHLVDPKARGVEVIPLTTIDNTRRFAEVRLESVAAEPLAAASGAATLRRLRDAAYVMLAADMLGASQTLLDEAVAYAKERRHPAEAPLMAAHAKAHLSEVSRFVARTSTEVHGGTGFTDLAGLHFWFKRVGVDRQLFGGPEQVRALAAEIQGLAAA